MSPEHPSYSQTNKWRGGLKFLLPTFKAHGRNSSLIEVKGERRESRGRAKGSMGQPQNAAGWLLEFVPCNLALACFDLYKSYMISLLEGFCLYPEWVGGKSSVFMSLCPLESDCLNLSSPEWHKTGILLGPHYFKVNFILPSVKIKIRGYWVCIRWCFRAQASLRGAWLALATAPSSRFTTLNRDFMARSCS